MTVMGFSLRWVPCYGSQASGEVNRQRLLVKNFHLDWP
jgi:hypothetical protein